MLKCIALYEYHAMDKWCSAQEQNKYECSIGYATKWSGASLLLDDLNFLIKLTLTDQVKFNDSSFRGLTFPLSPVNILDPNDFKRKKFKLKLLENLKFTKPSCFHIYFTIGKLSICIYYAGQKAWHLTRRQLVVTLFVHLCICTLIGGNLYNIYYRPK